ncbi:glycosyltransferase [Thermotoga profunda]|uniref:glycosyltransferase n=1 Tax=Thermotoga profunda TaxID=1508420 RepID=UPI000597E400|nr:glycosyltransferase [Thermotoga profunda]
MKFEDVIKLIEKKDFSAAKQLAQSIESDIERLNILGIINFYENNLDDALKDFKNALEIAPTHNDVLFNYAKVLFEKGEYFESWRYLTRISDKSWEIWDMLGDTQFKSGNMPMALHYYKKAYDMSNLSELKTKYDSLRNQYHTGKKFAILCLPGLDNFIHNISEILSHVYDVKLVVSADSKEIQEAYSWADIVWLEWANEMAVAITNNLPKGTKKIICRLHRYEAFANYTRNINWKNVDRLILVAEHIGDVLKEYHSNAYEKFRDKIVVVPNGLDLCKFDFRPRGHGYNIAIVALINHRKDPAAWLQVIGYLKQIDPRYTLHIAGSFQEIHYQNYFEHFIKEADLEENVKLYGHIKDIAKFLEDKNYILSTSIHEGHPYNIMEAMARGIKPIIHNYEGAKVQWPEKLVYNFIFEIPKIIESEYSSERYRKHVEDNYSLERQMEKILYLIITL